MAFVINKKLECHRLSIFPRLAYFKPQHRSYQIDLHSITQPKLIFIPLTNWSFPITFNR